MSHEQEVKQVRIPAENHWDSETLRNTDRPWAIKVRVKGQGSQQSWGKWPGTKFGGYT